MEEIPFARIEVEEVVKTLNSEPSPHELATLKVKLAGEYFFLSGRMDLCDKKEREFNIQWDRTETMPSVKLSSEATRKRAWKATEWGLEQTLLKNKMKRIDRLVSAINTKIRTLEMELKLNS